MSVGRFAAVLCAIGALSLPPAAQAGVSTGREATAPTRASSGDTRAGAALTEYCTPAGHFCIHYATSGADKADPSFVQNEIGPDLETAYGTEVGSLGWKGTPDTPPPVTQVYLEDLANPASGNPHYGEASDGQLTLENDFDADQLAALGSTDPVAAREATIAHEFNHVLQFRYGGTADQWQAESVATWMEDQVFPDANDYVHFVDAWTDCPQVPLTTTNTSASSTCRRKVYGAATFNHWLSQTQPGGPEVIRRTYEQLAAAGGSSGSGPLAYGKALGGGLPAFESAFAGFAAATAEWDKPGTPFPDHTYKDMARLPGALAPDGAERGITLDHTAYGLFDVAPTGAAHLTLHARFPSGVAGAIALVGRTGNALDAGTVTTQLEEIPNGGADDVTLDTPGNYSRITAVVVNTEADRAGSTWLGDGAGVCVHASTSASADGSCPAAAAPGNAAAVPAQTTTASSAGVTGSIALGLTYRLTAAARQARAAVLTRGLAFTLRCNRRCSASASLALGRAAARRLRLPRTVGTLRSGLPEAGTKTLRVKLSRRARLRFRHQARVTLVLTVRTTAAGGVAKSTNRRVTIVG